MTRHRLRPPGRCSWRRSSGLRCDGSDRDPGDDRPRQSARPAFGPRGRCTPSRPVGEARTAVPDPARHHPVLRGDRRDQPPAARGAGEVAHGLPSMAAPGGGRGRIRPAAHLLPGPGRRLRDRRARDQRREAGSAPSRARSRGTCSRSQRPASSRRSSISRPTRRRPIRTAPSTTRIPSGCLPLRAGSSWSTRAQRRPRGGGAVGVPRRRFGRRSNPTPSRAAVGGSGADGRGAGPGRLDLRLGAHRRAVPQRLLRHPPDRAGRDRRPVRQGPDHGGGSGLGDDG